MFFIYSLFVCSCPFYFFIIEFWKSVWNCERERERVELWGELVMLCSNVYVSAAKYYFVYAGYFNSTIDPSNCGMYPVLGDRQKKTC